MADRTPIEWSDATWNPVTGCTEVSPGCDRCYAKTFAERWRGVPGHYFENGFDIQLRPDKLTLPLRWTKPRRIFVNSMSDLFHSSVPTDYIAQVFAVMALAGQHTFQVLTKRHARMRALLSSDDFRQGVLDAHAELVDPDGIDFVPAPRWPLRNVWVGVSVETQQWADIRIPALLATPAAVRWLSCEPLLGPVDLGAVRIPSHSLDVLNGLAWAPGARREHDGADASERINWVVVGGESGRGARPMHSDWARSIRDECRRAEVPFLFKQWGEWGPMAPLKNGVFDWDSGVTVANDGTVYQRGEIDYPDGPRYGEAIRARHDRAHLTSMYRIGKKAAGRVLDDREWNEFPEVAA